MTATSHASGLRPSTAVDSFVDVADPILLSSSVGGSDSFFDDAFISKLFLSVLPGGPDSIDPACMSSSDDCVLPRTIDAGVVSAEEDQTVSAAVLFFPTSAEERTSGPEASRPPQIADAAKTSERRLHPRSQKKAKNSRPKNFPATLDDRARRARHLERNRVAANACRQRKKHWTSELEACHRDLAAGNKVLRTEVGALTSTVFELKNELLQHADCGCGPIDEFVKEEAERVRMRASARA